jgi:hypothetical protein
MKSRQEYDFRKQTKQKQIQEKEQRLSLEDWNTELSPRGQQLSQIAT